MIQENVIKVQNSTFKLTKETTDSQIKTFEGLLERNYHSNTRVVNDLLYWKDMAEHWHKEASGKIKPSENKYSRTKGNKQEKEVNETKAKRGSKRL